MCLGAGLLELAFAVAPSNFFLYAVEHGAFNDRRMAVLHIVHRQITVVLFGLLTDAVDDISLLEQSVPFNFSFVSMERILLVAHFCFPPGVGIPSAVSHLAMSSRLFPARYSAKMRRTIPACSSSISGFPSAPLR